MKLKLNTLLAIIAWFPLIGLVAGPWWYVRQLHQVSLFTVMLHGTVSGLWVSKLLVLLDLHLRLSC